MNFPKQKHVLEWVSHFLQDSTCKHRIYDAVSSPVWPLHWYTLGPSMLLHKARGIFQQPQGVDFSSGDSMTAPAVNLLACSPLAHDLFRHQLFVCACGCGWHPPPRWRPKEEWTMAGTQLTGGQHCLIGKWGIYRCMSHTHQRSFTKSSWIREGFTEHNVPFMAQCYYKLCAQLESYITGNRGCTALSGIYVYVQ